MLLRICIVEWKASFDSYPTEIMNFFVKIFLIASLRLVFQVDKSFTRIHKEQHKTVCVLNGMSCIWYIMHTLAIWKYKGVILLCRWHPFNITFVICKWSVLKHFTGQYLQIVFGCATHLINYLAARFLFCIFYMFLDLPEFGILLFP